MIENKLIAEFGGYFKITNMEKIYTLNYKRTRQIGPDDWETYTVSFELNDDATIKSIKELIASELNITVDKVDLSGMIVGTLHKPLK